MSKKDEKRDALAIKINENLATVFVDNLNIRVRDDGFVLLRFLALLPEGLTEQARSIVHQKRLKAMIDLLCSGIDYYPVKAKPKKKKSRKKAAS